MALNPCVKEILCALGSAVLGGLSGLIQAQKVALEALIASFEAQILALDVLNAPLIIARNVALQALHAAESAAELLPLGLISTCADLGDFNINVSTALASTEAELNDIVDRVNRYLSFRAELQAAVDEFNAILEQFSQIELTIQECATA
jgi:hypothetical protein